MSIKVSGNDIKRTAVYGTYSEQVTTGYWQVKSTSGTEICTLLGYLEVSQFIGWIIFCQIADLTCGKPGFLTVVRGPALCGTRNLSPQVIGRLKQRVLLRFAIMHENGLLSYLKVSEVTHR